MTLAGVDAFGKVSPTRNARVVTIVVLAAIWFVIAKLITADAVGVVNAALTLMLYLLVPWTVTNLIDFFFVRRGHYGVTQLFRRDGIYGIWSWRGLTAYGAGLAAEIPFMVLVNVVDLKRYYTGPLAGDLNDVDISWIIGAFVTAVVYLFLARGIDVADEQATIERGEREPRQAGSAAGA
jgi:nucleobase:cation symporter-1, NCS1 family